MEGKLFFERPGPDRERDALDYIREHVAAGSETSGSGGLWRCLEDWEYGFWLEELERRKDLDYARQVLDWAPSLTYFLVREGDGRIVGMSNIRYGISEDVLARGGSHIGYGIRPSERRKGYAKASLYLALLEEAELGEGQARLICAAGNTGSNQVILALGGKLVHSGIDPLDGVLTNYYSIDVAKSLADHAAEYANRISVGGQC